MNYYQVYCAICGLLHTDSLEIARKAKMGHFETRSQDVNVNTNFNSSDFPFEWARARDSLMAKKTIAARRSSVNHSDARFLRQEELIRRGLDHALAGRRIGLRASELCQDTNIARSTFHAHYRTCDEALILYELELEEEFVRSLPQNVRRDVAFALLLGFVSKYQHYFASAFQGRNMYLLTRLVKHACTPAANLNRRAYILYVCSVGAMILCWGKCDKFSIGKMEVYQKKLLLLRVMDYGL